MKIKSILILCSTFLIFACDSLWQVKTSADVSFSINVESLIKSSASRTVSDDSSTTFLFDGPGILPIDDSDDEATFHCKTIISIIRESNNTVIDSQVFEVTENNSVIHTVFHDLEIVGESVYVQITLEEVGFENRVVKSETRKIQVGENVFTLKDTGDKVEKKYTVTFMNSVAKDDEVKDIGHGGWLAQSIDYNATYSTNTRIFEGWFLDSGYTQPYDTNTKVTSDLTLYSKWSDPHTDLDNFTFSNGTISAKSGASLPESVILPYKVNGQDVTNVGWFQDSSIQSIEIPHTVITIFEGAFAGSNTLTDINVVDTNTIFETVNGNVYSEDKRTLYAYAHGKSETLSILDTTETIKAQTFKNNTALTSAVLPASVKVVENDAFNGASISSVIVESGVTYGTSVFANNTSLINVTIENGVTSIPGSMFSGCSTLETIDNASSITTIGASAFKNTALKDIQSFNAVDEIGKNAFDGANLTEVTIKNGIDYETYVFANNSLLTSVTIENGVTTIPSNMFRGCKLLQSVNLAEVTTIGSAAFANTGLTNISIPVHITYISEGAFYNCPLETITSASAAYTAIDNVLYADNKNMLHTYAMEKTGDMFTLPEYVEEIAAYAFYGCNLTTIEITNVTTIGAYAFHGTKLTEVTLKGNITYSSSVFANISSLQSVTFENVPNIPERAFYGCSNITHVDLDGVTTIGASAFANTGLTTVTLTDGLETIGTNAFASCSITKVEIPQSVTYVGANAFQGNSGIDIEVRGDDYGWDENWDTL